jgi:hypothetical protein
MPLSALRDIFHNASPEREANRSGMSIWVPGELPKTAFERAERGVLPDERGADEEAAAERAAAHRRSFGIWGPRGGERAAGWSGEAEVVTRGGELWDNVGAHGICQLFTRIECQLGPKPRRRQDLVCYTLKYLAWGWWATMAEVVSSGTISMESVRVTPMAAGSRSSKTGRWASRSGQAG